MRSHKFNTKVKCNTPETVGFVYEIIFAFLQKRILQLPANAEMYVCICIKYLHIDTSKHFYLHVSCYTSWVLLHAYELRMFACGVVFVCICVFTYIWLQCGSIFILIFFFYFPYLYNIHVCNFLSCPVFTLHPFFTGNPFQMRHCLVAK